MDKRIKPLLHSLESHGWRIEPKTKGWMCYPPDQTQSGVMIHKTPSDQNWYKQAERLLKKRGYKPE